VSKCKVSGRGVQPTGVRVSDLAMFQVSTVNAGQGDLDVTVSRTPAGTKEPVKVVKVGISYIYIHLYSSEILIDEYKVTLNYTHISRQRRTGGIHTY